MGQTICCAAGKSKKCFLLADLPDEMIVEIMLNLDYESLEEIMQVNKRFYELVLGNRRLWSKFKLEIGPCKHFTMPIPNRRFDSMFVYEFCCFKNLQLNFASDVKKIYISVCSSTTNELIDFLQQMPNLETVMIYDHKFSEHRVEISNKSLPKFVRLKELIIPLMDTNIFFEAENLNKLDCSSTTHGFLIKQNQLKELSLNFEKERTSIFSEDFTQQIKFRLEKLTVGDPGIEDNDVDVQGKEKILARFINLHQEHLQDLYIWTEINSRAVKSFLVNLKNLKHLNLNLYEEIEVDPDLFTRLKKVDWKILDLELSLCNARGSEKWSVELLEKLVECFPNVHNLKLEFELGTNEGRLKISNTKLENLSIVSYGSCNLIDKLVLVNMDYVNLSFEELNSTTDKWRQVFQHNLNIRNLKISDNNLSDNFFEELTELKELRSLEIDFSIENEIQPETYEKLFECCDKLNTFKMNLFPETYFMDYWSKYF